MRIVLPIAVKRQKVDFADIGICPHARGEVAGWRLWG
jgi:hypothetical protein